jgi:predicted RNA polymerase sigma factor
MVRSKIGSPDVALAIVDRLQDELVDYHAYCAARAAI